MEDEHVVPAVAVVVQISIAVDRFAGDQEQVTRVDVPAFARERKGDDALYSGFEVLDELVSAGRFVTMPGEKIDGFIHPAAFRVPIRNRRFDARFLHLGEVLDQVSDGEIGGVGCLWSDRWSGLSLVR